MSLTDAVPDLDGMPVVGFGTWPLRGEECRDAVLAALEAGYRHIDTAQSYANEDAVGLAIRDSGRPREELFVTTKVERDSLAPEKLPVSVRHSLERLGLDYVDLLLVHGPNPDIPLAETLEAMDGLRHRGIARRLGVSNFTARLMIDAAATGVPLFCNQVEFHPFLDQRIVQAAARAAGLRLIAFSPLARGRLRSSVLEDIAARHGRTAAQVMLRWIVQQERTALVVKSSSRDRMRENLNIFDFELSSGEMTRIAALAGDARVVNPSWAPDWDR